MDTLTMDVAVIGSGTAGLNARREVERQGGQTGHDREWPVWYDLRAGGLHAFEIARGRGDGCT
jgi:hypothetical protein